MFTVWCQSESILSQENFIVTLQFCVPAKGSCIIVTLLLSNHYCNIEIVFMRKCTTDGCPAQLTYDGQVDGILNMKFFCVIISGQLSTLSM